MEEADDFTNMSILLTCLLLAFNPQHTTLLCASLSCLLSPKAVVMCCESLLILSH